MSEHGRLVMVLLLVAASLVLVLRGPPRAEPLGAWEAAERCPVPVERVGEGVACLDEEEAARAGLVGGESITAEGAPDGGVGRMVPERLELFAAPVELNTASLDELASLPGVGRGLAERIAAARPFSSVEELRKVEGVGAKRFAAMRPRLR